MCNQNRQKSFSLSGDSSPLISINFHYQFELHESVVRLSVTLEITSDCITALIGIY